MTFNEPQVQRDVVSEILDQVKHKKMTVELATSKIQQYLVFASENKAVEYIRKYVDRIEDLESQKATLEVRLVKSQRRSKYKIAIALIILVVVIYFQLIS